ncbi:MAG: DUF2971 domain-containing protein [Pseudomonadota bacterium]|nr:DUF2971 domain-containing protein [Pseudomonadota bacterium]
MLYHYTTAAGLIGILKDGELRATHHAYLNDPSELEWFPRALFKQLEHSFREVFPVNTLLSACRTATEAVQLFLVIAKQLDLSKGREPFVASFSASGNHLGQWRAYGGGGNGFALGFDLLTLGSLGGPGLLMPVLYSAAEQALLARIVIDAVCASVRENVVEGDDARNREVVAAAAQAFHLMVSFAAPMAKCPAYSQEREWRIVIPAYHLARRSALGPGSRSRTRLLPTLEAYQRNGRLALASRLNLAGTGQLPLRHLVVGPLEGGGPQLLPARVLLSQHKLHEVRITQSRLPMK